MQRSKINVRGDQARWIVPHQEPGGEEVVALIVQPLYRHNNGTAQAVRRRRNGRYERVARSSEDCLPTNARSAAGSGEPMASDTA